MNALRKAMLEYRACPCDRLFKNVYDRLHPIVHAHASSASAMYYRHAADHCVDDAVSEAMMRAEEWIRSFMYECPMCDMVFLDPSGVRQHMVDEHRVLGGSPRWKIDHVVRKLAKSYAAKKVGQIYRPAWKHGSLHRALFYKSNDKSAGAAGYVSMLDKIPDPKMTPDNLDLVLDVEMLAEKLGTSARQMLDDVSAMKTSRCAKHVKSRIRRGRWQ